MPPSTAPPSTVLARLFAPMVEFRAGEGPRAALAFAMFFSVLCGYYILRPVRDEMGVTIGNDGLQILFTVVFAVMCAAVPVFGLVVRRVPRRHVVPLLYGFFIANLAAFWFILSGEGEAPSPVTARVFFVWASVFNLFVVSLFWILMSDIWHTDEAKRLYGFIAAGGTAGAVAGPAIARTLAAELAPNTLLLVSAGFLTAALLMARALRRYMRSGERGSDEQPAGAADILSGAVRVWQSPYLFRIALYILLGNLVGTFFYLEQSRIVGEAIADKAARVQFFASRDLAVSLITIVIQVFLTGRLMSRFGLWLPLTALPATATVGLAALTVAPTLDVIAAVMVAERAISFALANPAIKVLYTAVEPDEKFKAQNFIDTVVYRGGDAASGWIFNSLAKSLGLAGPALALLSIPVSLAWAWTSLDLARREAGRERNTT